ncbi:unknown [Clostridium sp. CAG:138]|jgi:hypothetical protein|nr:unknown [Clostridium sp. CAG:138]
MIVEAKDIDTLVVILSRLSYETEEFHLMRLFPIFCVNAVRHEC